jgi:hypothetical protein
MQLEDALVAPKADTLNADDLVQVYIVDKHPQGSKVITVADLLFAAISALPTSDVGLDEGDIWLDDGVLTVIQPEV